MCNCHVAGSMRLSLSEGIYRIILCALGQIQISTTGDYSRLAMTFSSAPVRCIDLQTN